MNTKSSRTIFSNIDWVLVLIFFALVAAGLSSIYSALYEGGEVVSSRFTNQIIWLGISLFVSTIVLLIDSKYIFLFSYIAYFLMLIIMVCVVIFGNEIKGAKSWIQIGGFSIQPLEFMKIATSLAIARYMSSFSFDISKLRDFIGMCSIIFVPVFIIFLQGDAGSATVFGGLLLMLYREGLSRWIYIAGISIIGIFVAFFIIEPFALFSSIIIFSTLVNIFRHGGASYKLRYIVILYVTYFILYLIFSISGASIESFPILMISFALTTPLLIYYMLQISKDSILKYFIYIISSIVFYLSISFFFDNVVKLHQQKRILDLLGVENDIYGWGYNVNQSKIAIGSGGAFGKGYLEGTQTKFNFVPEQSTDFIFCSVGEEFGFTGAIVVITLFILLIFRLIQIGDKMLDAYSRIYCYSIASIFFFHMAVNIGMTIGIAPVIGIPLPFFSYGGSSFMAFTIMLSIALKLNMDNFEKK